MSRWIRIGPVAHANPARTNCQVVHERFMKAGQKIQESSGQFGVNDNAVILLGSLVDRVVAMVLESKFSWY